MPQDPAPAPQQLLEVGVNASCHVPAGATLTGPDDERLTLPCGKVLKFWVAVELVYDPAAPEAEPSELCSSQLAELGVSGPEYQPGYAELFLEPVT